MSIKAPRGTKDALPDQVGRRRALEDRARRIFAAAAYREIMTPIFEEKDLFVRSIGQATDIVEKEMFALGGEGDLCLRPEMTAGVVRAYLEHNLHKSEPFQKFCYFGPLFRRERPQAGRLRQFHQIGIEALGSGDPLIDAEAITLSLRLLADSGVGDVRTRLNSMGCPECRPAYREALKGYFGSKLGELCPECKARLDRNVLRILDCKKDSCRGISGDAPRAAESLCEECASHHGRVTQALDRLGIKYEIDHRIVRGLDYYTKTVFEFSSDRLGAQDALGGGGRYDGLIKELGGPALGACGVALGVERILIASEGAGEVPARTHGVFIVTTSEALRQGAFELVEALRAGGIQADLGHEAKSFKAQMRMADGLGARYAIILGEDEAARGAVSVKELATGDQCELPRAGVISYLMEKGGWTA